jgi:hypothetical protein
VDGGLMSLVGVGFKEIRKMLEERAQHKRFLSDEDRTELSNAIHNHCYRSLAWDDGDHLADVLENTHFGYDALTDTELVKYGYSMVDGYDIEGDDMHIMYSMMEKLTEYELEKAITDA